MNENVYPQPHEDADNRPMLEAWRDGRLLIQACDSCGVSFYYPRPLCPQCWSEQLSWRDTRGIGKIVASSLVHRPNHPSFNEEVPIILAEVKLAEGPSMITRIVGCDAEQVRSGQAVELVGGGAHKRYPLPTFQLCSQ